MKLPKPKPFVPGLVRGQLPHSRLREATQVQVIHETLQAPRPILDYPSHAETPNEKSKRQLNRAMPQVKIHRAVVQFNLKLGDWIL